MSKEDEILLVINAMQANPLFSNVDKYTIGMISRMAINGYLLRSIERESGAEWQPMATAPHDGSEFIVFAIHNMGTKSFMEKDEKQVYRDYPLTYTATFSTRPDHEDELIVYRNPGASYGFKYCDASEYLGWMPMPKINEIEGGE